LKTTSRIQIVNSKEEGEI